ncbi:hypothetical protein GCM10022233_23550 [Streptomyces shaanxiensis]|uniref:Uncharacterized protein n=1 Tax=Streptomyces shaanxiensis TaxID=653357 RepID=A0ABP7USX7_9ACTN
MQEKPPSRRVRLAEAAAADLSKWRVPTHLAGRIPSPVYLSTDLVDVRAHEYSDMCPERAQEAETIYETFCANSSLAPSQAGWGFLHCTVRDRRGRRRRLTLTTNDLSYHRLVIDAIPFGIKTEISWDKYAYMRAGWPGREKWRGNWHTGEVSFPWRPTQRDACPEETTSHVHSILFQEEVEPEAMRVIFSKSPSGHCWTMLDTEAPSSRAMVMAPASENEWAFRFGLRPGVAVVPGWPTIKTPELCADPGCDPV